MARVSRFSNMRMRSSQRFIFCVFLQILAWITDNFMYSPGDDAVTSPNLHIAYMSLRTSTPLVITMHPSENGRVRKDN